MTKSRSFKRVILPAFISAIVLGVWASVSLGLADERLREASPWESPDVTYSPVEPWETSDEVWQTEPCYSADVKVRRAQPWETPDVKIRRAEPWERGDKIICEEE